LAHNIDILNIIASKRVLNFPLTLVVLLHLPANTLATEQAR